MQQNNFQTRECGRKVSLHTFALLALLALAQPFSSGQARTPDTETAPEVQPSANGASLSGTNAALLKELESMRARIEELEQQLKRQASPAVSGNEPSPGAEQNVTTEVAALTFASSRPVEKAATAQEVTPVTTPAKTGKEEPFAYGDFTWLNGNPRIKEVPLDTKFFTPEIRADVDYTYDFRHPQDDTISGSSEIFRANEVQLTQFGVGGDFHYDNVRARFMTQYGMYSTTTPRNDASYSRGQWMLDNAYRYLSEAYGGYHFDKLHGINVDAGIFMSYVGLFSYYNFDNWAYQPSYVSSNTPWFFTGVRTQIFPTAKLKIEPWLFRASSTSAPYL